MKIAELVMVQIMGSMEDDNFFSTLTFMKMKLWNDFMSIWIGGSYVCITFLYY
jgi:hypothetical protein